VTSTSDTDAPTFTKALVAAGALFVDDQGRVLLVRPTYKSYWDIPGGYVEPGETPSAACIRELDEELGIRPQIGDLLSVDWAPHPEEGDKVLFIFDGGTLTEQLLAEVNFRDGELDEYTFAAVGQLRELTVERLARRLEETLAARRAGAMAYLEHGRSPR
jgi:ADP-ribose pyrophosphatase YjhB (NUDIX family)